MFFIILVCALLASCITAQLPCTCECSIDNCLRDLAGTSLFPSRATVDDCMSFMWTHSTVTDIIAIETVTGALDTNTQNSSSTSSPITSMSDTGPRTIATYAIGCSNTDRYSSACRCLGVEAGGTKYSYLNATLTVTVPPAIQNTVTIISTTLTTLTETATYSYTITVDGSISVTAQVITTTFVSTQTVDSGPEPKTVTTAETLNITAIETFTQTFSQTLTDIVTQTLRVTETATITQTDTTTTGATTVTETTTTTDVSTTIETATITETATVTSINTTTQTATITETATTTNINTTTQTATITETATTTTGAATVTETATTTDLSITIQTATITKTATTTTGAATVTVTATTTSISTSIVTSISTTTETTIITTISTTVSTTTETSTTTTISTTIATATLTETATSTSTVISTAYLAQLFTTITRTATAAGVSIIYATDSAGSTIADRPATGTVIIYEQQPTTTVITTGPVAGRTTKPPVDGSGSTITDDGTVTVQITQVVVTITQTKSTSGLSTAYPTDAFGATVTDGSGTVTVIDIITPTEFALQLTNDVTNAQFKGQYLNIYSEPGSNYKGLKLTPDFAQVQKFLISSTGNVTSLNGDPFVGNATDPSRFYLQQPASSPAQKTHSCWVDADKIFRCESPSPLLVYAENSTSILRTTTNLATILNAKLVGPLIVKAIPYLPDYSAIPPAAAKRIVLQADPSTASNDQFSGLYLGVKGEVPSGHSGTLKRLYFDSTLTPSNASVFVADPVTGYLFSETNEHFMYDIDQSIQELWVGFPETSATNLQDNPLAVRFDGSSMAVIQPSPGYPLICAYYLAGANYGKVSIGSTSSAPTTSWIRPIILRGVLV
ncbi:hypothetical protein H072_3637 [Dactylellina haptotyla CBS 200.50]|uniref:GLEYA adhesin domain-containing protein n=1 Tax=Dactylellina haptotyla (strain CBS 200.50) TaxID=1284197 RepID=S8C426_DACHA|nr:hypothetical protein H072_3637 [Dactylellina haptotyla CBS 200.50]